ncbi:hypothetical protein GQR58_014381 [Nymphon striatum]|nr:hypothetical protein GQR58_014381 [Nymphon striatum]
MISQSELLQITSDSEIHLRQTFNDIERHIRCLKVLGEDDNNPLYISLIKSKLPTAIRVTLMEKMDGRQLTVEELRRQIDIYVVVGEGEDPGFMPKEKSSSFVKSTTTGSSESDSELNLAHYKTLKLEKIPEIVASTSSPQTWHISPRRHGFCNRSVNAISIIKPIVGKQNKRKKNLNETGITSTLYNPINENLPFECARQDFANIEQILKSCTVASAMVPK